MLSGRLYLHWCCGGFKFNRNQPVPPCLVWNCHFSFSFLFFFLIGPNCKREIIFNICRPLKKCKTSTGPHICMHITTECILYTETRIMLTPVQSSNSVQWMRGGKIMHKILIGPSIRWIRIICTCRNDSPIAEASNLSSSISGKGKDSINGSLQLPIPSIGYSTKRLNSKNCWALTYWSYMPLLHHITSCKLIKIVPQKKKGN